MLDHKECDEKRIVKLTGFPGNEVTIKGWRVEPLHMPPVVSNIL